MFNFKKKSPGTTSVFAKVSNNSDSRGDDYPVHTMQTDLYEIENPGEKITGQAPGLPERRLPPLPVENKADTKMSSPFLTEYREKMSETKSSINASTPIVRPMAPPEKKPEPAPQFPPAKPVFDQTREVKPPFQPAIAVRPTVSQPVSTKPAVSQTTNIKPVGALPWTTPKVQKEEFISGDEQNKKNAAHKYIIAFGILILLLGLGAGGYYAYFTYWMADSETSQTDEPSTAKPAEEIASDEKPAPVVAPVVFFTDKANSLVLDVVSFDSLQIKDEIKKYADQVYASGQTAPIEFTVVDSSNTPITFSQFAKAAGISFSPSLISNLSSNFSLFYFKDDSVIRAGLAIKSANAAGLKNLLLQEEKTLAVSLKPLYLVPDFTPETKVFNNSSYANLEIRYANIDYPEPLSVDYAIKGDQLLIGTSKMTLRSIIDYVSITNSTSDLGGADALSSQSDSGQATDTATQ